MLLEGQIEMVMVPMKKENKLNDTFKELRASVAWVRLPSYYIPLCFGHTGDGILGRTQPWIWLYHIGGCLILDKSRNPSKHQSFSFKGG